MGVKGSFCFILFCVLVVFGYNGGNLSQTLDEFDCGLYNGSVCTCEQREDGNISARCSNFDRNTTSKRLPLLVRCCHLGDRRLLPPPAKPLRAELFKELHFINNTINHLDMTVFRDFYNVEILNVSRNDIENLTWENCILTNLTLLDISHNKLQNVDQNIFSCNSNLSVLSMKDNLWNCLILKWFLDWVRQSEQNGLQVIDKQDIKCSKYHVHKGHTLKKERMWDIINSCPKNCSCIYEHMKSMVVNCSGRNFHDFPALIPKEAAVLDMSNNEVKSFQHLLNDSTYQRISILYLEYNHIESLNELEGVQRYVNISTLRLKGNRLSQIRTHILEGMNLNYLSLSGNPWNCDCRSGTALYEYLLGKTMVVKDMKEMTCSPTDERHPNKRIVHMSPRDFCYVESSGVQILDIVNALLALTIVIIVVKLLYDWLHFRRKGRLPLGPIAALRKMKDDYYEKKYQKNCNSEKESFTCMNK